MDDAGAVTSVSEGASSTEAANAGVAVGTFEVNLGADNQPDPAIAEKSRKEFSDFVPEPYREKDWFKNTIKSDDPKKAFFSQFENAQSMTGKVGQFEVPNETTPPEKVKEFYKALGVPDSVDAYTVEPPAWATPEEKELGTQLEAGRTPEFMAALKKAAMESGVTPKQFQALQKAHDENAVKFYKNELQTKTQTAEVARQDFIQGLQNRYGSNWDNMLTTNGRILETCVDPSLMPQIAALDNDSRAVLLSALDGVRQRYINEDNFSTKQASANTAVATAQSIRAEAEALMMTEPYANIHHALHEQTKAKVNALFKDPRILAK